MSNLLKRVESEPYPGMVCVYLEDLVEDGKAYAWGKTLEEAQAAWGEMIVEHVDDHIHDMRERGEITPQIADECFTDIDGIAWLPY